MKRLLLSLLCCSPLVFFPATSISLDITGPANEQSLVYDQYGPVSPNETLWAISTKLRPDNSVSIQQTLVAIYKLNPYVFYEGNINKIIPQSVINIPPFEFVAQQTDTEAMALINKYSKNRKKQTAKTPKPPAKVKETVQDKPPVVKQEAAKEQVIVGDAEVIIDDAEVVKAAQLAFDKEKLAASELELQKLQEELLLVSEQLLVTTEENQILKLKLQPLEDTISELQIQMEDEALIQKKLQKIIDDYRAELDAVVEPPFSGEGMVNELLRAVTSSLLNLAIVILAPILVLLALFLVITRVRSKRLLAAQEQEMAESTAILMEESGQFDSLLTDEFGAEAEPDLDFSNDEHVPVPDTADLEQVELDDEIQEIDLSDDSDDSFAVDLTSSDVVDLTASDEVEASEDDPFGIGALSEEELISSVDLDEPEVEHNEDDPFGIGALVDEEDLISGVDLVDTDTISPEEQADLDLAAQWESQLSEESEETDVKQNDAVEQDESEFDLTAASGFNEQASEQSESPAEIDSSKSAIADPVNDDFVDDIAELDLEALAELESSESVESLSEQPELEIEQPEETAELSLEVLAELESSESVESLSEQPKLETEPSEETAELDLEALAELESSESVESLSEQPELETEQPEETAELSLEALAELESSESGESLSEQPELETEQPEETAELDLEALAELESSESGESLSEQPVLETEQPEETAELSLEALAEFESSESVESLSELPELQTEPPEETAELDLEALAELESSESVESLSELSELEIELPEETAELDLEDLAELESSESVESLSEQPELQTEPPEETAELDLEALAELESSESVESLSELSELEIELPEETAELDLEDLAELESSESVESLSEQPELERPLEEDITELDLSTLEAIEAETDELNDLDTDLQEELSELDLSAIETIEPEAGELNDLNPDLQEELPELDLSTLEAIQAETDERNDLDTDLQEELSELDLSSLETIEPETDELNDLNAGLQQELGELDLSVLETVEPEFDLSALDTLESLDGESSLDEQQSDDELTLDLDDEFDLSALDGLAQESGFKPTPLAEFEAEQEALEQTEHDMLAKQLSDVAFKSDAPLPKIDAESSDFIDIETLLENSEGYNKDEPYAELDLDLGLDEFPDVVNSGESVDIDDDENGIGAQLDLARAYLEIDDKEGAKEILLSVLEDSNGTQRKEIDKLLSRL